MTGGGDEPRVLRARDGQFIVPVAAEGNRLDVFVAGCVGISVAAARRLIAGGLVQVDGRGAAKGSHVVVGGRVDVAAHADPAAPVVADEGGGLVVVYQDPQLVAIDKPAGMPSHPLRTGERGTAANQIVARFPDCASASPDPREGGLVHRLDTGTSGVLIAARSRDGWHALRAALAADDCEKVYLCQVRGRPPEAGRIDATIGRRGRRGGVVRVGGGGRGVLSAETRWNVVASGKDTALVEARLHSGRAHQVRAHLAAAGFPIVGDDRYGGAGAGASAADGGGDRSDRSEADGPTGDGLRLHALSVRLRHPVTGDQLLLRAPPPAWAKAGSIR